MYGYISNLYNRCVYLFGRTERKENWPVCEKLEIEPHKRSRLLGVGGINLKKLFAETGVLVSRAIIILLLFRCGT